MSEPSPMLVIIGFTLDVSIAILERVFLMWPCVTNPGEVTNNLGTCFIGPPLVGRDIVLTFLVKYSPFVVCLFLS